jgi:hypothetical protein
MSFEQDKARLIKELADAQAETRAAYGLKPRVDPLADQETTEDAAPGRRTAVTGG